MQDATVPHASSRTETTPGLQFLEASVEPKGQVHGYFGMDIATKWRVIDLSNKEVKASGVVGEEFNSFDFQGIPEGKYRLQFQDDGGETWYSNDDCIISH